MPKRLKKTTRPKDVNQLSHHLVRLTTEQKRPAGAPPANPRISKELRAYMSKIGRKGGPLSAAARLEKIPKVRRIEIATDAARKRWADVERRKKESGD